MRYPIHVAFRDVPASAVLDSRIRVLALWLRRFFGRIRACDVTVSAPHRHRHAACPYRVAIRVGVPSGALVVARERRARSAHEDAYLAVRDAFRAARREVQDYARRRRGDVKRHAGRGGGDHDAAPA